MQNITDAMISMRGQVDGSNFLSTIQNAGGYQRFWSKDFVAGVLPPLINEMKRPVGNALYMMERSLYQGRVSKGAAEGLGKVRLQPRRRGLSDRCRRAVLGSAAAIGFWDRKSTSDLVATPTNG